MCCFFELNSCCAPSHSCMCRNAGWNRSGDCCCRFSTIQPRSQGNIINNINTVREVAQFIAPAGTVAADGNVLFSVTTFNNTAGDVTLGGGGLVTLAPGVYEVDYFATINNTGEGGVDADLALSVNSVTNTASQSTNTIPAASTQTVSGSTIIFVPANTVTNVYLTNVSAEATDELNLVNANLIVTKLS